MTLVPFSPESLDRLALRLFDLAAIARHMANSSRANDLPDFQLHVNKLNDWLIKMESWAQGSSARLETAVIRQRGARRAQSITMAESETAKGRDGRERPGPRMSRAF